MPFSSGFLAFSLADFSIVRSDNTARSLLPQKSVENGAKIAPNTKKNGENGDNGVQNGVQNGDSGVQIPAWLVFAAKKWAKGGGNCRNRCVGEGKNGIMVAARVRMISDDKSTWEIEEKRAKKWEKIREKRAILSNPERNFEKKKRKKYKKEAKREKKRPFRVIFVPTIGEIWGKIGRK
jgi:hypothetical protein